MTMIACIRTEQAAVLIADGLISSLTGREGISLPTVGKKVSEVKSLTRYKAHGTIEKLVVLPPNAIVAWAGDVAMATAILQGIKKFFDGTPLTEKFLMAHLNAEWPTLISDAKNYKVALIFLIQEGNEIKMRTYNCYRDFYPTFGVWVSGCGSGLLDFIDFLDFVIPTTSQISDQGQRVVGPAMSVAGLLLCNEVFTGAPIAKGYGAHYEIGGIFANGIQKFSDYCCVFWAASDSDDGVKASPVKLIRSFSHDGLICHFAARLSGLNTLRLEDEETFITMPLLGATPPPTTIETPNLNAQFQANVCFYRGNTGETKLGSLVEYRHDRTSHVIGFSHKKDRLILEIEPEKLKAMLNNLRPK